MPYNRPAETPVTNGTVPRDTYYGIINRDFTKTTQNIGTIDLQYHVNDVVTLENKMRQEYSILNYIGTIPESPAQKWFCRPAHGRLRRRQVQRNLSLVIRS